MLTDQTIYIIIGPTASGKSDYAVDLALKIGGEIISADSVQVYKHLDIGSGKITHEEMRGVAHHGLDIADPGTDFTVADWLRYAEQKITEITSRGHVPIICGGTGLYIEALLYGLNDNPGPDYKQRKILESKSLSEIQDLLKAKNLEYYNSLNNSEQNNKERLIRKLELNNYNTYENKAPRYKAKIIRLEPDLEILQNKISIRLDKRLESDALIDEIKNLIYVKKIDMSWLKSLGLEYRYVTEYVEGNISKEEMKDILFTKIKQYAKRQITWNKRYDKYIDLEIVK